VVFTGIQTTEDTFYLYPQWQKYGTAHTIARTARWVVPKTQDITYVAKKWTRAAAGTEFVPTDGASAEDQRLIEGATKAERNRMRIPALYTIGSSLLFEALIVLLAMWKFTRQDY